MTDDITFVKILYPVKKGDVGYARNILRYGERAYPPKKNMEIVHSRNGLVIP